MSNNYIFFGKSYFNVLKMPKINHEKIQPLSYYFDHYVYREERRSKIGNISNYKNKIYVFYGAIFQTLRILECQFKQLTHKVFYFAYQMGHKHFCQQNILCTTMKHRF